MSNYRGCGYVTAFWMRRHLRQMLGGVRFNDKGFDFGHLLSSCIQFSLNVGQRLPALFKLAAGNCVLLVKLFAAIDETCRVLDLTFKQGKQLFKACSVILSRADDFVL